MEDFMKEIKCENCYVYFDEIEANKTEVPCDDCGSHTAWVCPNCEWVMDAVLFDGQEREKR